MHLTGRLKANSVQKEQMGERLAVAIECVDALDAQVAALRDKELATSMECGRLEQENGCLRREVEDAQKARLAAEEKLRLQSAQIAADRASIVVLRRDWNSMKEELAQCTKLTTSTSQGSPDRATLELVREEYLNSAEFAQTCMEHGEEVLAATKIALVRRGAASQSELDKLTLKQVVAIMDEE